MNAVFFNRTGRLRSGWRFTIFLFSFSLAAGFANELATRALGGLPVGYSDRGLLAIGVRMSVTLAAALVCGWLCGRWFEELPFRALGFGFSKGWLRHLLLGLLFGAGSLAFAALLAFAGGGLEFRVSDAGTAPILLTLGTTLLVFVGGAAAEEVLFRGYPLQTFTRAGLAVFGVVLTSLLFATTHNGNPSANPFSWFNTFLAGIWFAAAWFRTRDLWFAFAMHFAWNWFQGAVFGINVSGLAELTPAPLLSATDRGPAWLTGADYGLEGGVACTVALLVSTALIWFLPIFRPDPEMLEHSRPEQPKTVEG